MGAAVAVGTAAFGTATSAISQYKAGKQAQRVAAVNADAINRTTDINTQLIETETAENSKILDYNASIATHQADDAILRGATEERRLRVGVGSLIGSQRAAFAAQGIEVGSGTAADVQASTAQQGEEDALTIRTNAMMEAWGFKVASQDIRNQIDALKKTGPLRAKSERESGYSNALSTRMGGSAASSAGALAATGTIVTNAGGAVYNRFFSAKRG